MKLKADHNLNIDTVAVIESLSTHEKKLQAIVLDHAPEEVWGGLPDVHLVEEWRGGKFLVPAEWLK